MNKATLVEPSDGRVGAPVVVFDLDATLVAGDSMAAYLRTHLPRRPVSLMLAVLTVPVWAPALLSMRTRRAGQRLLIALAVRGRSAAQLHALTRDFAQAYVTTRARAYPLGVAAVQSHLSVGHRVLIATECWDALADALCAAMGLKPTTDASSVSTTGSPAAGPTAAPVPGHGDRVGARDGRADTETHEDHTTGQGITAPQSGVEVVAEDLATSRAGWGHLRVLAHYKDGKIRALQRAGVTFPVAAAYSDSLADLPLLQRADMPHVVNPGRWQRRRFQRALGTYIPHHWKAGGLPPAGR